MRRFLAWPVGIATGLGLSAAIAQTDLSGRWIGNYHCDGQPESAMAMEFPESGQPLHEGAFSFDAGGTRGSFNVTGRMLDTVQFRIVPGAWIEQPLGFGTLALAGRIHPDGRTMDGVLTGCAGGWFKAARELAAEETTAEAAPEVLPEGDRTPPQAFGGAIGGKLASAPSAEAQCRVLGDWYAPVVEAAGFDGLATHKIIEVVAPAFLREAFEPVFGVPYELMDQREQGAIGMFIKGTCYETFGMVPHRNVFADVFRSPMFVNQIAVIHQRKAEADAWVAEMRGKIDAAIAQGPAALDQIQMLEWEIEQWTTRVTPEQTETLRTAAAGARAALKAAAADALIADLDRVGNELNQGHLGTALRVADQAQASGMAPDQMARVVEAAQAKAGAILDPKMMAAAALAAGLPASLEGLKQARAALRPFEEYRQAMDRTFGSIDPKGILKPLYDRLLALESNRTVLAELSKALAAAALGEMPEAAVERLAAEVTSPDPSSHNPEIYALIADARDQAEVAATVLEDRSTSADDTEPKAMEIMAFALQRVREVNARLAAEGETCTSGAISDPLQALKCLQNPATWTGQHGSRVTLVKVIKIGCEAEAPGKQYLCDFVQEIRFDIAGGEAFGVSRWGDLTQDLTSGEAVDARFIRAADGGWSIVTGDLR